MTFFDILQLLFVSKCSKITPERKETMNVIILQIPISEYGSIATLAAVANMPLDKYVVNQNCPESSAENPTT